MDNSVTGQRLLPLDKLVDVYADLREECDGKRLAAEVRRLREENARINRLAGDRNYCDSCGKSILNVITADAELKRFREREPLVQAAIDLWFRGMTNNNGQGGITIDTVDSAMKHLRAFALGG